MHVQRAGPCELRRLWPSWRPRSRLLSQIKAHQPILAAREEESIRQRRKRAHIGRQDLHPRRWLETLRRGRGAKPEPSLRKKQKLVARQRDAARLQSGFAPTHLAGLEFHAPQFTALFLAAMPAIEKTSVTYARRVMVRKHVVARPDFLRTALLEPKQTRAGAVTRRKKNHVFHHQRRGGAYGGAFAWTPRMTEDHASVCRLQSHERFAGQGEYHSFSVDGGHRGRSVARFVTRGLPSHLARCRVQRHNAGAFPAARHENDQAAFRQRRRGPAEKALSRSKLVRGIAAPQGLAGFQSPATQFPLGAKREHASFRNGGRRPRAGIEAEVVVVIRGVTRLPQLLSASSIEALHDRLILHTAKQKQPMAADGWSRKTLADLMFPHHRRPLFRPRLGKRRRRTNTVALRAQQLRPVSGRRGVENRSAPGSEENNQ